MQMTPADDTAVQFSYRSAQWTEFVLYPHNHATPPPPKLLTGGIKYVISAYATTSSNCVKPLEISFALLSPRQIV